MRNESSCSETDEPPFEPDFRSQSPIAQPVSLPDLQPEFSAAPDPLPEAPLFASFTPKLSHHDAPHHEPQFHAPPRPPMRFPNFADVGVAAIVLVFATILSALLTQAALYFHLFGVATRQQAATDIHYALGSQAAIYLLALAGFVVLFPYLWHTSFFSGVEWRISTAFRMRWHLVRAALFCIALAIVDSVAMPGPKSAPIDEIFRRKDAPWLMAIFGVTLAPFFEELIFRGLLLPAVCTAYDWAVERIQRHPAPWPDAEGRTQWTLPAMAVGSVLTSLPFSLIHAWQNGGTIGPFLLLVGVSLVLCWVRLSTRSLAASTVVHACYNLILFALMFAGTGGFKHMDKM
jgi:membrane protease YdiL (CAAX protease family)